MTDRPLGKAIMEPIISNLDHLGTDDIAGVRQIYGTEITNLPISVSIVVGQSYTDGGDPQVNFPATSYSAVGLPPGLTINSRTGYISGVATKAGDFDPVLIAHGRNADAYKTFPFTVRGLDRVQGLLAILPVDAFFLVPDPIRPRIYTSGFGGINMIDTMTRAVTSLYSEAFSGLSVSADGSQLFFFNINVSPPRLKKIDLASLKLLPGGIPLPTNQPYDSVVEGLDGRDYVADATGVKQFDAASGALQVTFAAGTGDTIAISRDRKTLFVTHRQGDGGLSAYDISTPNPSLQHQTAGYFGLPVPSLDGQYLYYTEQENYRGLIARADLPGLMPVRSFGPASLGSDNLAIHANGSIYRSHDVSGRASGAIFVYDPTTLEQTADVELGDLNSTSDIHGIGFTEYIPSSVVLDHSGRYFFSTVHANGSYDEGREVWMFSTDLASFPPHPYTTTKNLLNVSTRTFDQGGSDPMIGGFILQGPKPKKILVRGIGPSLPITGAMSNPVLDLYDSSGTLLASNDNWISNRIGILQTQAAPSSERESAIVRTLQPGAYTAVVRDARDQPGLALVEVYDLDAKDSLLVNISTRGKVGTGDNAMIGGFIIGGKDPTKVLVRAIGPSLSNNGVAQPLSDPVLELRDGKGKLVSTNDNWRETQGSEIVATGIPPPDNRESAIVATLTPGNYTAIVRGKNNATGTALVEVYNVDANLPPQ
ncbi:MAG TPA: putative Ig domain-containing protein [Chthoniobacterales bacterium]